MNPFLRYLADKNSAHTHTDRHTHRQTDRHTPLTTRPDGLRRAGNDGATGPSKKFYDTDGHTPDRVGTAV